MKYIFSFIVAVLLATGCGLIQKDKFEPGGAYAASATQAAMPELFVTDSAFDLVYKAITATFDYERNNRAALWAISPNIKHSLDKMRPEASQVWLDYAVARQAYLSTPTEANLTALKTVLGKLQQLDTAALAVFVTKGNP